MRKRERDLLISELCVARARACLFIFASGLRMRYTRWILSLLCARVFLLHMQQQAEEKKQKKTEAREIEKKQKKRKKTKKTQKRDAGREIRKELSSFVVLG